MAEHIKLKRTVGLTFLTFYGLGNILGAGIYVLIGKVVGTAGIFTPVSFLVASLVAGISALTYAELSARMPLSAGEAVYLYRAFGLRSLSLITGLMIALAGIVSAATISRGFVGYLEVFISLPDWLVIIALLIVLGGVAAWGISQSIAVAAFLTVLEIIGLLLIVKVGGGSLLDIPERLPEMLPPIEFEAWQGILIGAFLAFYAYIGFEDMVNIAEEVKSPERVLPKAIILALIISTLLYILISLIATLSVPLAVLAQSDAPLALIYQQATGRPPVIISQIALVAVVNGALIQIIMSSRILYGMSRQGWIPAVFGYVSAQTRTPLIATVIVTALVMSLALWLPLLALAKITSFIILCVFALVNLALVLIKRADPSPQGIKTYPMWVPVLGFISALALISTSIIG